MGKNEKDPKGLNNTTEEGSYSQSLEEQFKKSFESEPFTVVKELGMAFSIGESVPKDSKSKDN